MPSKKKKYNARFPAGRIKKIMQTDEEIGKVAQAVPVIISRTLELFVEELITKTMQITTMKNARTLSPHHMKQCILSESRFDFLKDLVKSVPEVANSDDDPGSFSDSTVAIAALPRQRSNSRDVVSSVGGCMDPLPAVRTAGGAVCPSPLRPAEPPLLLQDTSSSLTIDEGDSEEEEDEQPSDEECMDLSKKSSTTDIKTHQNSVGIPPPARKPQDSDSEDYDT